MEVVVVKDAEAAGKLVARAIAARLKREQRLVLGLATGSSPLRIYAELIRLHKDEGLSFAHASAFLLDEYVGLPDLHPEAYHKFIAREFTSHVDFSPEAVRWPDGSAENIAAACLAYDAAIVNAGGVDIQILGIGTDGHIAFNEPGSSLGSRTRLKTLTQQTREDNARFFDSLEDVPNHVVTQGIATIMDAKHVVLVATGAGKAGAVAACIEGPITSMVPASALQMHPHVTFVVDEEAAVDLTLVDYYRRVWDAKPSWQGI